MSNGRRSSVTSHGNSHARSSMANMCIAWNIRIVSLLIILTVSSIYCAGELWPLDRPDGMPVIQSLEVMCGKDHMDVHLTFSHPFEGIVSSKGQHGDPRCVYVPPSTGQTFFSFRIAYARCGTKPDLNGQFYENTVVVQYDKDLLEVWDEAKRLRCEWFNDYEKTASKPPMVIADLDVVQLDFRGDNVDCWMEIQHGKGPWAPPVSGIVPLGSTLTLVVAINDYRGEFDMRVKSCAASDGAEHVIQLSDEYGCVLRPKMISRFLKAKAADERASVITYAFFHAFKFPDALSVHIRCKVEICRHGCLDHCQLAGGGPSRYPALDRNDNSDTDDHSMSHRDSNLEVDEQSMDVAQGALYVEATDDGLGLPAAAQAQRAPPRPHHDAAADLVDMLTRPFLEQTSNVEQENSAFPHGPRRMSVEAPPAVAGPRNLRRRRSPDVGVSGLYEVISEADLAFSPDSKAEAVTVFQGRIREEVVYGVCLPAAGFGALFVAVAGAAVGAALAAGALLHRHHVQRARLAARAASGSAAVNSLASWMALRLLWTREPHSDSREG